MFNKIPKAIRLFFLIMSVISGLGIYLSGYNTVHWLIYLPTAFLFFASVTGICPGIFISKKIVGDN